MDMYVTKAIHTAPAVSKSQLICIWLISNEAQGCTGNLEAKLRCQSERWCIQKLESMCMGNGTT